MSKSATQPKGIPIGVAAKQIGVTTRTLRYWQELGLITPAVDVSGGDRLYQPADIARASHVKDLQNLFGFSLHDIKVIVAAEDTLANIKDSYHLTDASSKRLALLEEALRTTEGLLAQIDDKLGRLTDYREQVASKVHRLQEKLQDHSID